MGFCTHCGKEITEESVIRLSEMVACKNCGCPVQFETKVEIELGDYNQNSAIQAIEKAKTEPEVEKVSDYQECKYLREHSNNMLVMLLLSAATVVVGILLFLFVNGNTGDGSETQGTVLCVDISFQDFSLALRMTIFRCICIHLSF